MAACDTSRVGCEIERDALLNDLESQPVICVVGDDDPAGVWLGVVPLKADRFVQGTRNCILNVCDDTAALLRVIAAIVLKALEKQASVGMSVKISYPYKDVYVDPKKTVLYKSRQQAEPAPAAKPSSSMKPIPLNAFPVVGTDYKFMV